MTGREPGIEILENLLKSRRQLDLKEVERMISQSNEGEEEEDRQDDQSQPLLKRGSLRKAGTFVGGQRSQLSEERTSEAQKQLHTPKVRVEDFDDDLRKKYDMIKQSLDYQMSEIVKEIDVKKLPGAQSSPGRRNSR
jgi:hypothetical protein